MSLKKVIALAIGFAAVAALPAQAQQVNWPDGPVTIIVPYGTGGGTDSTARALAATLSSDLGVPVTVENHSGAGGAIALTHFLQNVEPDGQTVLVGQTGILTTTAILNDVEYKREDFKPVLRLANPVDVLVASNEFPPNNPTEFIEYSRENPDALAMVMSSVGSQGWMGIQQLQTELGFEIPSVPIPSSGGASQASMVAGNHAQAGVISLTGVTPFLEGKQLKAIGLLQPERSPLAPDLPTFAEAGFDVAIGDEVMMFARQETPDEVIDAINAAVQKAFENDEFLKTLENLKLIANYGDQEVATGLLQTRIDTAERMLGKQ